MRNPEGQMKRALRKVEGSKQEKAWNSTYWSVVLVYPATIREPTHRVASNPLIVLLHKNNQFSNQDSKRKLQICTIRRIADFNISGLEPKIEFKYNNNIGTSYSTDKLFAK